MTPGTKIGDYEIKALLGSGGMGEVYRARDARLGRDVAIKVLPAIFSADSDRLRRFEQEARAAAALNHPNILAVHQMGTFEGTPYLVSELLEGETLREQLQRGKLTFRSAIDYGLQIARGLSAAHEKGIVHRDLKPENLFVTKDGRVKILDFGLAKLTQSQPESEQSAPTLDGETEPGAVMGTVGYMSPEQVRGQSPDHRTDIFSFGAILYEMLAGKRPFQKPTSPETMNAILNEDPQSISQLASSIPPAVQRAIHRCLEKSPEQRFQSASDLAFALDALSSSSDAITTPTTLLVTSDKKWAWPLAGLLIVLLGGLFFWRRMTPAIPQITSVVQLTNDGFSKRGTQLLYDGSRLYFTEGEDFDWRIMEVSAAGGATARVVTTVPNAWAHSIAPDSSALLVTSTPFGQHPLWWQPLPTGAARRLGDLTVGTASIFPDGEHIVYTRDDTIGMADRDGSNPRVLAKVKGQIFPLTISPDAQRVRFGVYDASSDTSTVWDLYLKDHSLHQLLRGWTGKMQVIAGTWTSDEKYFVFASGGAERLDLWALPEDDGVFHREAQPIRLTAGPLSYGFPVPSRDGTKIYAAGAMRRGELVRFDVTSHQFIPFLQSLPAINTAFSRDGKWLVYISYPEHALWRCRVDGSERQQLTYPPLVAISIGGISPDDMLVAFTGIVPGSRRGTYIASIADGKPRLALEDSGGGAWSPDGSEFLVSESSKGYDELHKLDLHSGTLSTFQDGKGKFVLGWSAQGKPVALIPDFTLWSFDPKTKKWSQLLKDICASAMMSSDGQFVYCETSTIPYHKVVRIRLVDGRAETVMEIKDLRRAEDVYYGTSMGVAPDGSVLFTRDSGSEEIYALTVKWP